MYVIVGNEGNWDIDTYGVVKATSGVDGFMSYVRDMEGEGVAYVDGDFDDWMELVDVHRIGLVSEGEVVGWVVVEREEGEGEGARIYVLMKLEEV